MTKSLKEMGLEQLQVTIQIVATPEKLDIGLHGEDNVKLKVEKAVALAFNLDIEEDQFKINAFRWDFSQEE